MTLTCAAHGKRRSPVAAIATALAVANTAQVHAASSGMTVLASFDGSDRATTWKWRDVNDPVMGGQSRATWSIANGVGIFDGETKIVPSLKAPGFCNAETDEPVIGGKTAPPAGQWLNGSMLLKVRSALPYSGFKFSFAGEILDKQFKSYKSEFAIPADNEWHIVSVPFANFSNDWSPFTGRCDNTPPDPNGVKHECCSAQSPHVCPSSRALDRISQLGFWAEGVAGKFHLEVQWIAAGNLSDSVIQVTKDPEPMTASSRLQTKQDWKSVCSGPIQNKLLFNITGTPSTLPGSAPDEDQADAVCCDPQFKPFAEPSGFFMQPNVALFSHVNSSGITTFYDSVCGKPLFRAPVGRDFDTWKQESITHGWPSFRQEEIIPDNVKVDNSTGEVLSSCNTHLGSFLPDAEGARYCIDLSCIAGSPISL